MAWLLEKLHKSTLHYKVHTFLAQIFLTINDLFHPHSHACIMNVLKNLCTRCFILIRKVEKYNMQGGRCPS